MDRVIRFFKELHVETDKALSSYKESHISVTHWPNDNGSVNIWQPSFDILVNRGMWRELRGTSLCEVQNTASFYPNRLVFMLATDRRVPDPILQDHFWMNPFATHFSLIKASDMVLVDSQGYVVEGGNHAMINEAGFWIHSEVHHARPDVMAVAHAHSQYGRAWSAFGKPIEMLDQGRSYL